VSEGAVRIEYSGLQPLTLPLTLSRGSSSWFSEYSYFPRLPLCCPPVELRVSARLDVLLLLLDEPVGVLACSQSVMPSM
jgi:hypothetical protein